MSAWAKILPRDLFFFLCDPSLFGCFLYKCSTVTVLVHNEHDH